MVIDKIALLHCSGKSLQSCRRAVQRRDKSVHSRRGSQPRTPLGDRRIGKDVVIAGLVVTLVVVRLLPIGERAFVRVVCYGGRPGRGCRRERIVWLAAL